MNKKSFDCVEMKRKIQAEMLEESQHYPSEAKYRDAKIRELRNDPIWSRYLSQSPEHKE